MMTMTRSGVRTGLMIAASALLLAGCGRQQQMTCPSIDGGQAGEIHETPAQVQEIGAALGTGSENEIAGVVPRIQARHPQAGPDMIANYMVVAYCPKIAARSSATDEKVGALDAFAKRARQIAATMPHR